MPLKVQRYHILKNKKHSKRHQHSIDLNPCVQALIQVFPPPLLTILCLPPALNCPPEYLLYIQPDEILVIMQVQNKVLPCPKKKMQQ